MVHASDITFLHNILIYSQEFQICFKISHISFPPVDRLGYLSRIGVPQRHGSITETLTSMSSGIRGPEQTEDNRNTDLTIQTVGINI